MSTATVAAPSKTKKFITALKENTDGIRTKIVLTTAVVVTVVVVGAYLNKLNNQQPDVNIFLVDNDDTAIPDVV